MLEKVREFGGGKVKKKKLFFFELKICSKLTAKKLVRKRGGWPCHSKFNGMVTQCSNLINHRTPDHGHMCTPSNYNITSKSHPHMAAGHY